MTTNVINGIPPARGSGQTGRVGAPKVEMLPGSGMPDQPVQAPDVLRLTPETLHLRKLEASLGNEPPLDQERIETLRNAIANGEYQVNSTRVAGKLLDLEGELFT